jgi:hypothetical protein
MSSEESYGVYSLNYTEPSSLLSVCNSCVALPHVDTEPMNEQSGLTSEYPIDGFLGSIGDKPSETMVFVLVI